MFITQGLYKTLYIIITLELNPPGLPKGIRQSHQGIFVVTNAIDLCFGFNSVTITKQSFFHALGLAFVIAALR